MNKKRDKIYPKEILDKIPKGLYCHGNIKVVNGKADWKNSYVCPFWFRIKNEEKQENGYCILLGKGDYEINREKTTLICSSFKEGKEIKKKIKCGPNNPCSMSLLWDMCKECNLKIEDINNQVKIKKRDMKLISFRKPTEEEITYGKSLDIIAKSILKKYTSRRIK